MFGRFRLEAFCGRGSSGEVWRARDELLGETVALKIFRVASLASRSKQEVRRARELTHPNIVRVHDYFEEGERAAVVMEFVAADSLAALRSRSATGKLSVAEVAGWLPQLCAALDYAHHQAGIVHRDIKPANLLLTGDGVIKMVDFGLASVLHEAHEAGSAGTPAYMSPQQRMGEPATAADDIHAVGVTLHELLTGKMPDDSGSSLETLPEEWRLGIRACLRKDAAARPTSLGQLAAEIFGGVTVVGPARRTASLPQSGRKLAAVVGLLLAGLGLAWWMTSRSGSVEGAGIPGYLRAVGRQSGDTASTPMLDLPLAGDGWERSKRLMAAVREARPCADRFGLPARAMRFQGIGRISLALPSGVAPASDEAWTMSAWMRAERSLAEERVVWELGGDAMGSHTLGFTLIGGRARLVSGRRLHAVSVAETSFVVADGQWHHIVAAGDGRQLWLWVDGSLVQTATYTAGQASAAAAATLVIGGPRLDASHGFAGDLGGFQFHRRLLHETEIWKIAYAGPQWESPALPFALSRSYLAESEGLEGALQAEFGAGARLADWEEIRKGCPDAAAAIRLAERLQLRSGENALVMRDGKRWFERSRHYFLSRLDGQIPDYYLAHEEIGGHTLALGSWHGLQMRALVRYPGAPSPAAWVGRSVVDPTGMLELPGSRDFSALLVQSTQKLSPQADRPQIVGFRLGANSEEWKLVMTSLPEGRLQLDARHGDNVRWSQTFDAGYGDWEHTIIVSDERMVWRVQRPGVVVPLGENSIAAPGLRAADVSQLRWELSNPASLRSRAE